jgi:hypothetical protein
MLHISGIPSVVNVTNALAVRTKWNLSSHNIYKRMSLSFLI